MLERSLENLRSKSHRHRTGVAFVITGLAAAALMPLWLWNSNQTTGFHSRAQGQQVKEESPAEDPIAATASGVAAIPNPITEVGNTLQKQLAEPVTVVKSGIIDGQLVVHFAVENTTFAQLTSPFSQSYLVSLDNPAGAFVPEKVTTLSGEQMVPGVLPGQKKEGLLYFASVEPGSYQLKFPAMRYEGESQTAFIQSVEITVGSVQMPRS